MDLLKINENLGDVCCLKAEEINYEELCSVLRDLRSAVASECDTNVAVKLQIIDKLFDLLGKISAGVVYEERQTLAFRIGLQAIVNAMVADDESRAKVSALYFPNLTEWLKLDDAKVRNYICAALHKLASSDRNMNAFEDEDLLKLIVESAVGEDVDFGHILLEKLLERGKFVAIFNLIEGNHRIYLIHTLKTMITKGKSDYAHEIKFLAEKFKRQTDAILKTVSDFVEKIDVSEVSHILEVLASISYLEEYQKVLQSDNSFVINCVFLLRAVHQASGPRSDLFQVLKDAVDVLDEKSDASTNPSFGFKGHLIQILGNLSWRHRKIQDTLRELECIPVLLECCAIDPNNPFIQQWSILALRNLAEGNEDNQKYIRETQPEKNRAVVQELSLTLHSDSESSVNIAPLNKK